MTNLTEQYRELEQDFFAYQKMLNEANKDLNKYYLENIKLKELLKECLEVLKLVQGETVDFPRTVDECIDKISQVLGEE